MAGKNGYLSRVVFMGTPELAVGILSGLRDAGYALPLVITQPDKPMGRGKATGFSPVKAFALSEGLDVYQPENLRDKRVLARINEAKPDAIVVAAYGKKLPALILEAAPLGCLNAHASLLPAYRGAAPIQWALLDGATRTGVTIMKMDEGIDTGPILSQESLSIGRDMDYGALYSALTSLGTSLLLKTLPLWARGEIIPREQPPEGVSYARLIKREDEIIAWSRSAVDIANQIRAFSPKPGAAARVGGREVKILSAELYNESADEVPGSGSVSGEKSDKPEGEAPSPGTIVKISRGYGPVILTGKGYLLITRTRPAGKKPMDAWSWLNGSRLNVGQSFE